MCYTPPPIQLSWPFVVRRTLHRWMEKKSADLDWFVNNIWEKWVMCTWRKVLDLWSSAYKKGAKPKVFLLDLRLYGCSSAPQPPTGSNLLMNGIFTVCVNATPTLNFIVCLCCFRYNCNRYNEDDAKAARDAQEVIKYASAFMGILILYHHPNCRTSQKHLHTSVRLLWSKCRSKGAIQRFIYIMLINQHRGHSNNRIFKFRSGWPCLTFHWPSIFAAFQSCFTEVPVLLQPLHEPHAKPALWAQALRSGEAEDGRDAAAQHVLDWGAVSKEGCGRALPVPLHTHVHLRLCLLPQEEQPVHYFWGKEAINDGFQCWGLLASSVDSWHKNLSFSPFIAQNNQADLENATEVLSGYLERDISQDSLQDIKQKVQDKYRWWNLQMSLHSCDSWVVIQTFSCVLDTVKAGEECCYSMCMKAMRRTCGSTLRIEDTS